MSGQCHDPTRTKHLSRHRSSKQDSYAIDTPAGSAGYDSPDGSPNTAAVLDCTQYQDRRRATQAVSVRNFGWQ